MTKFNGYNESVSEMLWGGAKCVHEDLPAGCYRVRCQLSNKCVDDSMSFRKADDSYNKMVDRITVAFGRYMQDNDVSEGEALAKAFTFTCGYLSCMEDIQRDDGSDKPLTENT
jgi:hypothetical protein